MIPVQETTAVLLIGHGTRNQQGVEEFLALVPLLQKRLSAVIVAPAFLELQSPAIGTVIARLATQGIGRIIATPLLLFSAGHAQLDIPAEVQAAAGKFSDLNTLQTAPLALEPSLLALSRLRFEAACRDLPPSRRRLLLLVGRGSRDADATEQMQEFAAQRAALDAVPARVAFLAMAEPPVAAALEQVASEAWEQVIVQPHLLFQGELLEELRQRVERLAIQQPDRVWRVASHLAADLSNNEMAQRHLLDAICARIQEVERD